MRRFFFLGSTNIFPCMDYVHILFTTYRVVRFFLDPSFFCPFPILHLFFFLKKKYERDGDGEEKHYMLSKFCSSFAWRVEDYLCKVGLEVMVVFMLIFWNRCWNLRPNNFVSFPSITALLIFQHSWIKTRAIKQEYLQNGAFKCMSLSLLSKSSWLYLGYCIHEFHPSI